MASRNSHSVDDVGDTSSSEHNKPQVTQFEGIANDDQHVPEKHGASIHADESGEEAPVKMTLKRFMAFVAQAFLWTGSQIPVYLFGGIPPYIYGDIGGHDRWIWMILANLLSLAAICPFVGSLSDLFGRRYVALVGAAFIVLGMIICAMAQTMNVFIGGMVFAGIGAGINELTALAATSEMAPTAKRGKYVAILVFTIVPFCPSVLWAQLIASHSSWRYCALFCALWALTGLILTAVFYFPPPRTNSEGLSRREILRRTDFVGGGLSVSGMILFSKFQWSAPSLQWLFRSHY